MNLSLKLLHLYPQADPFKDWRVLNTPDGTQSIVEFNTAKLGAQPTQAQLDAVTEPEEESAGLKRRKTRAQQEEAVGAIEVPTDAPGYVRWFLAQAAYASAHFTHEDDVTGSVLFYDINPHRLIQLNYLQLLADSFESAPVLARTNPDQLIDIPHSHTRKQVSTLRLNVVTAMVGIEGQGRELVLRVLAANTVPAIRALTLGYDWAWLPPEPAS